jgi:hypothetical protein
MAREGAEAIIKRDLPDRKSMFWLLLVLCLPQIRMRSDVEQPLDATCPTDSASLWFVLVLFRPTSMFADSDGRPVRDGHTSAELHVLQLQH